MCQLFSSLFHLPLPEGSVDNILGRMNRKPDVACREIQDHIAASEVAGADADETGCHVNGKNNWFHVWQTKLLTLIVSFKSRGHQVADEYFPGSFLYYVIVGHPSYRPRQKDINCALLFCCGNC